MTFANRIGRYRRKMGMTQEALARQLGVTNQAVSKWESGQCCPDISLLPKMADLFGITLDELFGRETPSLLPVPVSEPWSEPAEESAGEPRQEPESGYDPEESYNWKDSFWGRMFHKTIRDFEHGMKDFDEKLRKEFSGWGTRSETVREVAIPEDVELPWEDDDTLRVALFIGKKMVSGHPARERIEVCLDGRVLNVHSECSISCGDVSGNVWAGDDVDCGNIGGSASIGGDLDCQNIYGDAKAGGDVDCQNVMGNLSAGGDVDCDDVSGNVRAAGDVDCGHVEGSVSAAGDVTVR